MLKHSTRIILKDYGITLSLAIAIGFFIRTFLIEAYQIPNFSMKPTLIEGDTVFAVKWPLWLKLGHSPERGDVVIYTQKILTSFSQTHSVKRILGLEKDTITIKEGTLFLNNKPLDLSQMSHSFQENLPNGRTYETSREPPFLDDFGPEKIPPGFVFVLNDFRSKSTLSGNQVPWAITPLSSIQGKVLWIWLSLEKQSHLKGSSWFPQFRFKRMFQRIQ